MHFLLTEYFFLVFVHEFSWICFALSHSITSVYVRVYRFSLHRNVYFELFPFFLSHHLSIAYTHAHRCSLHSMWCYLLFVHSYLHAHTCINTCTDEFHMISSLVFILFLFFFHSTNDFTNTWSISKLDCFLILAASLPPRFEYNVPSMRIYLWLFLSCTSKIRFAADWFVIRDLFFFLRIGWITKQKKECKTQSECLNCCI